MVRWTIRLLKAVQVVFTGLVVALIVFLQAWPSRAERGGYMARMSDADLRLEREVDAGARDLPGEPGNGCWAPGGTPGAAGETPVLPG